MKRLKILLRQFTIENHIYDKKFIYKGDNILKLVNSELRQLGINEDSDSTSSDNELSRAHSDLEGDSEVKLEVKK